MSPQSADDFIINVAMPLLTNSLEMSLISRSHIQSQLSHSYLAMSAMLRHGRGSSDPNRSGGSKIHTNDAESLLIDAHEMNCILRSL